MESVDAHRMQFGFTVTFHYLFPQLTMGLTLVIVVLKTLGLRGDEEANSGIGAFYLLSGLHVANARRFLSVAVIIGAIASFLAAMPTGDWQAKVVYQHQPATFAAMQGHFQTEDSAAMVFIGQPNTQTLHLDNPIKVPGLLSFLTRQRYLRVRPAAENPQHSSHALH